MQQILETAMQRLGYNHAWLEAGVITPEILLEQWRVFQTSDDQNAEHYRHGAFVQFLGRQTVLPDALLEQLLALEDDDAMGLRELRISMLISSGKLQRAQLEPLMARPDLRIVPRFQVMFTRQCVIESLRQDGLTASVFATVQTSRDKDLHELLLARSDLQREHLLWLLEHGQNKAIRNRAKQMLGSKRFRLTGG
jgi:hypothetical protein